jgi:hypothetical protein
VLSNQVIPSIIETGDDASPKSTDSVFTLASGMGDELNRLLEAERLIEGRRPGVLLLSKTEDCSPSGDSPSTLVLSNQVIPSIIETGDDASPKSKTPA